jgi:uncharacterized protein YjbJ (UPF0337 family)
MSSTTDIIKGITNEAVGKAKADVGDLTGDPKLQVEGRAQELLGSAQKAVGNAKGAVKDAVNKNL